VCDHANDAEARRCKCTGYGMGDILCRCRRGKSLHEDGTGRCVEAAARCHEFVPTLDDPFIVTTDHIEAAALAIVAGIGIPATMAVARRVAAVALTAGRESVYARDRELERIVCHRDRLLAEVAALTEEKEHAGTAVSSAEPGVVGHQNSGAGLAGAIRHTTAPASL
jgi:hypothetical protein